MHGSDSTTVIGHAATNEGWLELDDNNEVTNGSNGIRQTIELDVVSAAKGNSQDFEQYTSEAVGQSTV